MTDDTLRAALEAVLRRDDLCDDTDGEHHTDEYVAAFLNALDTELAGRAALAASAPDAHPAVPRRGVLRAGRGEAAGVGEGRAVKWGDIRGTLSVVDRATPELHRARWHFLTPIGHGIPPKGTLHRQQLMLLVALRRVGRELVRGIPGAASVPWAEVGATWGRRLEWLGTAYIVAVLIFLAAYIVANWR